MCGHVHECSQRVFPPVFFSLCFIINSNVISVPVQVQSEDNKVDVKKPNSNIMLPQTKCLYCLRHLRRQIFGMTVWVLVWFPDVQWWGNRRPLNRRLHKRPCGATHSLHLPALLFSCFYVRQRTGTRCTQMTTKQTCHQNTSTPTLVFPLTPTFIPLSFIFRL